VLQQQTHVRYVFVIRSLTISRLRLFIDIISYLDWQQVSITSAAASAAAISSSTG